MDFININVKKMYFSISEIVFFVFKNIPFFGLQLVSIYIDFRFLNFGLHRDFDLHWYFDLHWNSVYVEISIYTGISVYTDTLHRDFSLQTLVYSFDL